MRAAYHSEYRPGAADTSELDPCIAAETRLKKSAFSTSKKRTFCLIGVLAFVFLIFLILLVVFLSGSSSKPSNIHTVGDIEYEDMESATLVRAPPRPPQQTPATTTTTTVAETDRSSTTTTTRRPSTTTTTPRPQPRQVKEIVIGSDTQPTQIKQRVNVPVEIPMPPTTTTTTTTQAPARPTIRTRPSSVFPTAALRGADEATPLPPYERKTETIRESCTEHATAALGSGVYRISPAGSGDAPPLDVYCRMDEDDVVGGAEEVFRAGGAWTYVQSLSEEAYFYNRTFAEYQAGFGRVDRSHWLGLDAIHRLAPNGTGEQPTTLRIELYGDHCAEASQCSGRPDGFWWGEWEFGIAPFDDLYRLHIAPSTHGNLSVHTDKDVFYEMNNGQQFSTADRDNDRDESVNCGQTRNYGGWWHKDCTMVALNGLYGDDRSRLRYQVFYRAAMAGDIRSSYHIHPKRSIMMVRPRV